MKACGLCHGDIAPYEGKNLNLLPMPVVCGHEFGGTILEIKGETDQFKKGDKVVATPIISCGNCYYCNQGLDQLCIGSGEGVQISNFGTQAREGALAERVVVPLSNLFKLPDDFNLELTGIIEPAVVAYNNTKDVKNSNVVVFGLGAIGLLAVKLLKLNNNTVIAVGNSKNPLKVAKRVGADFAISSKDNQRDKKIIEFLNSSVVDYVLLYYVDNKTVGAAVDLVKKCGEIKIIGLGYDGIFCIDNAAMLVKSIKLFGYMAYSMSDFKNTVDLVIEEKIEIKDLIPGKFPLEKTKEAFEYKKREHVAKVIVTN